MQSGLGSIRIIETNITYEPLTNDYPKEICKIKDNIIGEIEANPAKALEKIELLMQKYPDFPILTNWRYVAYKLLEKDDDIINNIVVEDYKKFPNYFFSKAAYAQMCIDNGNWKEVPKIFNNSIVINDLYPERNIFHATEVITFYYIMGQYVCHKKQLDQVRIYLDYITEIDKDHKTVSALTYLMFKHFPLLLFGDLPRFLDKKKDMKHKKIKK